MLSLALLLGKKQFEDEMRIIGGGYSIYSRTIIFFIEITGTFWGICGAIGAWRQLPLRNPLVRANSRSAMCSDFTARSGIEMQ